MALLLSSKSDSKWEETDLGEQMHGSWDFNLDKKER